jgi:hypothetical protein
MSGTSEQMALTLANKYADYEESPDRTKARELKAAVFDGVCIGIHAAGYCMTPAGVMTVVQEAWRKIGPRPAASAWNVERKQWAADMVREIVTHEWFV